MQCAAYRGSLQRCEDGFAYAGISSGLLFDWALPLMTAYVTDEAQPNQGSVYWALSALQHGLQGCDDKTIARYGSALLDACQRLLEADTLPEHLLPLLLPVISQVHTLTFSDSKVQGNDISARGTGRLRGAGSHLMEHAETCAAACRPLVLSTPSKPISKTLWSSWWGGPLSPSSQMCRGA